MSIFVENEIEVFTSNIAVPQPPTCYIAHSIIHIIDTDGVNIQYIKYTV